jgi:hypothetical protein
VCRQVRTTVEEHLQQEMIKMRGTLEITKEGGLLQRLILRIYILPRSSYRSLQREENATERDGR